MKGNQRLDDILEECLERLRKGDTVEQCLQSYPEAAAELRPLLLTAQAVKKAAAIQPRREFRAKARAELHRALAQAAPKKAGRPFLIWQHGWAVAVAVVLAVLLAGTGTVFAAGNSMPDEPLYPVKLATEQLQVRLTASDLDKAELYAKLAEKRVEEITRMAEKGKTTSVEKAAEQLNEHLVMVTRLVPSPKGTQEATLMAPAPVPAPTTATPRPTPVPSPAPRAAAPQAAQKDTTAKSEREVKLKKSLTEYAKKQSEALRGALEKAPEEARPALKRALTRAEAEYQKALKALNDD